jgi:glycosyltransferase involved in cell wall biosynthesis
MKILHVSEAYGGGVTSAVNSYVENSPQFDHYLFATPRDNDRTGEEGESVFKEVFFVKRDFAAIKALRTTIRALKPDVIHIHSTYAGVFCRVLPYISKHRSVYTPHGYAFLRDDHPLLLKAFYWIEKLLSKRTRCIAGCGREERNIAAKLIGEQRAFELINVCDPLPDVPAIKSNSLPVIGMIGRISNQKGYDFFLETAKALCGKAHFKWIGGGDPEREALLREADIEVTGWITRSEVVGHLKGLDLYFHTAAWEGFPISVLEASQLGKPIILREIGPFSAEGLPTIKDIAEAKAQIQLWLEGDQAAIEQASAVSMAVNEYHSFEHLQQALNALYTQFTH